MINQLRKKFIIISVSSILIVFGLVVTLINLANTSKTNRNLDMTANMIAQYNGKVPNFNEVIDDQNRPPLPPDFNKDTPFTTRYFIVTYDLNGKLISTNTSQISDVSIEDATTYANTVVELKKNKGWYENYRYNIYQTNNGKSIIFINGINDKLNNQSFLLTTLLVITTCSAVIILLIIIFSKKAIKPAIESYEKQKQFITNANHELKTPLTLIKTNIAILENEIENNEWLNDLKDETENMSLLVNQIVSLARLDEDNYKININYFDLSKLLTDCITKFDKVIKTSNFNFSYNIQPNINYNGNSELIREVLLILIDNSIKYCDQNGKINITLKTNKNPILTIDNSYENVRKLELTKLFDRFYRDAKARTSKSGFGIGLSVAKEIINKHHANIVVQNIDNETIRFKIKF